MSKKQEFINELKVLLENYEWKSENAKNYWDVFVSQKEPEKKQFTDNGKLILQYMKESDKTILKAKDIGDGLLISSRTASGALRKLVSDGYVEKVGTDPVVYSLTEKGLNVNLEGEDK